MKIIVGITGASGMIYARMLLQKLLSLDKVKSVSVVASETGEKVWQSELESNLSRMVTEDSKLRWVSNRNLFADIASGSAGYDAMFVVPCSMNTLAKVANGVADSLMLRAADVMLKERKKLVLSVREAPYNLIHIENMKKVTLAGGIIFPLSPVFYTNPQSIEDLVSHTVDRMLSITELYPDNRFMWWGG